MSYLVLARKYRPASFDAICGQEHVTTTLRNTILRDRIAHAYLFAGPRGIGKTSIARIFARALNCEKGPTPDPCGECQNCQEVIDGMALSVREIDGASHNSVENVRELIEHFRSLPAPGYKYKIYIIDEVHMLSTAAFNALLKSLEEPPPNTVFILATTEAHRIPETVISRCQRLEFRALSPEEIRKQLKEIAEQEQYTIDEESLIILSRLADGSMRDGQSLLDRVAAFCDGNIKGVETAKALGMAERKILFDLSLSIVQRDSGQSLKILDQAFSHGIDPVRFLKDFVEHWRNIFLVSFADKNLIESSGISLGDQKELQDRVANLGKQDIQDLMTLARNGADQAIRSSYPRYAFEALVVQMSSREPVREVAEVIAGMRKILKNPGQTDNNRAHATEKRISPIRKRVSKSVASEAKKVNPVEKLKPVKNTPKEIKSFDWKTFVESPEIKKQQVLVANLRLVSVSEFSSHILKGSGPEISIAYLNRDQNKQKLIDALQNFSGVSEWKISFEKGGSQGKAEPDSLAGIEAKAEEQNRQQRITNIKEHPEMERLLKTFPGSVINEVKIGKIL